jgi:flagellum-specific peptidoglycan hydrolase FlgJ
MTKLEKIGWLEKMAPAAIASHKKHGVPTSVVLAQAFVESADRDGNPGQSELARTANNYFGIKARHGEEYVEFNTKEFKNGKPKIERAAFRKFRSGAETFEAHGKLLAGLDRYQPAMEVADDPLAFCLQLQLAKYSTRPNYASFLASIIKTYNLTKFDVEVKEAA